MATIAICCLVFGATSASVYWCYRMYKARSEPDPLVYVYAPETKLFDQGYTEYPRVREEVLNTLKGHRTDGFHSCKFIQRIIHVSVPMQPRRESILYNVDLRRYSSVINYVAGPRTYFAHFPACVAQEICERVGAGATIVHGCGDGDEQQEGVVHEVEVNLHANKHTVRMDEELLLHPEQDEREEREEREERAEQERMAREAEKERVNIPDLPLVLCLHGTDETAFDTVLLQQEDGSRSWLDLSDREGFVVGYLQARGQWADEVQAFTSWRPLGDLIRTLWVNSALDENKLDIEYVKKVVADLKLLCPRIDLGRVYLVGFSNGGFMACDIALESRKLALQYCSVKIRSDSGENVRLHDRAEDGAWWSKHLDGRKFNLGSFHVTGVCIYMGGITRQQQEKQAGVRDKDLPRVEDVIGCRHVEPDEPVLTHLPEMLIVTGEQDPQIFNSLQAWLCFYKLGFYVKKVLMPEAEHRYLPNNTKQIWDFFQKVPND